MKCTVFSPSRTGQPVVYVCLTRLVRIVAAGGTEAEDVGERAAAAAAAI